MHPKKYFGGVEMTFLKRVSQGSGGEWAGGWEKGNGRAKICVELT